MVKKLLSLFVLSMLFISCGSSDKNQAQARQIDSIVNARVRQRENENTARNDSTLKAIEAERADAIMKQRNEAAKEEKRISPSAPSGDSLKAK